MVEVIGRFDVVGAVVERDLVDERPQKRLLLFVRRALLPKLIEVVREAKNLIQGCIEVLLIALASFQVCAISL